MKISLSAETSSLLVEQPCGLLHPDSTGDLKICNKSDHGPRLLPMISFVDSLTVLQRQDWLRGKLLYKREKKTQNRGPKIRGRNRTREETETKNQKRRNPETGDTQTKTGEKERTAVKKIQKGTLSTSSSVAPISAATVVIA